MKLIICDLMLAALAPYLCAEEKGHLKEGCGRSFVVNTLQNNETNLLNKLVKG